MSLVTDTWSFRSANTPICPGRHAAVSAAVGQCWSISDRWTWPHPAFGHGFLPGSRMLLWQVLYFMKGGGPLCFQIPSE